MDEFERENVNLWNELPFEERNRLMPYMLEAQILHVQQCKQKAINAHNAHIASLDKLIANIGSDLRNAKK